MVITSSVCNTISFQAALPSYSTTHSHLLSFLAPLTPLLGDAELPLVAALLGLLSPSAIQLFTYGNSANSLNVEKSSYQPRTRARFAQINVTFKARHTVLSLTTVVLNRSQNIKNMTFTSNSGRLSIPLFHTSLLISFNLHELEKK